jgi:hypothetical protein
MGDGLPGCTSIRTRRWPKKGGKGGKGGGSRVTRITTFSAFLVPVRRRANFVPVSGKEGTGPSLLNFFCPKKGGEAGEVGVPPPARYCRFEDLYQLIMDRVFVPGFGNNERQFPGFHQVFETFPEVLTTYTS